MRLMKAPPLSRYRDDPLGLARDFLPLKPDQMSDLERRVLAEFAAGRRSGLGLSAWQPNGLMRVLFLSYIIVAWKTLCFPNQLTAVYGKNMRKALPWINGFAVFASNCDPLVRRLLQFDLKAPRLTVDGDDYWRVVVFNPNESDLEHARNWMTNVVYYDFDRVPEWLIRDTQNCVHRDGLDRPVSLSIFLDTKRRNFPPTEPPPYREADGSSDTDD